MRAARPDIALSTDIIVGFPGETEAEFAATLEVVETVGFAQAYSFKYSPRPGTPARTLAATGAGGGKRSSGCSACRSCSRRQQTAFNSACVGRVMPVLFERAGRRPGQLVGRSPYLQSVHAQRLQPHARAHASRLKFWRAGPNSLSGVILAAGPWQA